MALKIKLTPDDFASIKLVSPGWYPAEIVSATPQKAKTDGSDGVKVRFKGLDGEAAGVPFSTYFSEKFQSRWINLIKAVIGGEPEPNVEYEIDEMIGQSVLIYVKNDEYQGRTVNNVEDFRHM